MTAPRRILLVRLSHLGDVCHALPVFHALREAWPQARMAWVVQPEFAGLLDGLPGLEQVFHFRRKQGLSAWFTLRRELRAFAPDLAVDAQGNLKSASITWSSGAKDRAGLARADWREPFGARAMTRLAPVAASPHAVDRALSLARFVAPGASLERYDLPLSEGEQAQGAEWLEGLLPDRGRPRRILHLAVPGDRRSLPGASFATLARGLEAAGEDWLLLSGPGESELGRSLERELPAGPGRAHLVDQRGLRSLAALLGAAGRAGVRFLVCDSGPCHVAAAVGASVDLVSGPQDPELTGPWPPPARSAHRIHRAPAPAHDLSTWNPEELLASLLSAGAQ